jgi:putative endonuclease
MSHHIDLGKKGEELAAAWLTAKGFAILHTNWRSGRYEVDIIAGRSGILHFIEVKTRTSVTYGHPEEGVSRKKITHILQSAAGWLYKHPDHSRVQYDVLAITWIKESEPEYFFIEDVYL